MAANTRRALLGAFALAPAALAQDAGLPPAPPLPPLPEGFIWVSVRETSWNALLEAAEGLGRL